MPNSGSMSSTSTEELCHPVLVKQEISSINDPKGTSNNNNAHQHRHTSWSGHKSTSDGDILTLDSPRGNLENASDGHDRHVRSLSGHLLGMKLSPDNSVTYSPEPEIHSPSEIVESSVLLEDPESSGCVPDNQIAELKIIGEPTYPTQQLQPSSSENVGRKHRRVFSGGVSNPSLAHRRINSGGNAAFVNRHGEYDGPNNASLAPFHTQYKPQPPPDKSYYPSLSQPPPAPGPIPAPHEQNHHGHSQWANHQRRSPPSYDQRRASPPSYDQRRRSPPSYDRRRRSPPSNGNDHSQNYEYGPQTRPHTQPPHDDRDHHYANHGHHPPLYVQRKSPIPPPPHLNHLHGSPHLHHEGMHRQQPRHEDYYSRVPHHGAPPPPPHHLPYNGDRYSPSGSTGHTFSDYSAQYSPDHSQSSYPDEVSSNSSSTGPGRPMNPNHRHYNHNPPPTVAHHGYYPPPRGSRNPSPSQHPAYPVQYSNPSRNDKRHAHQQHPPSQPPPLHHPLSDYGPVSSHKPEPYYNRRTSTSDVDSDGTATTGMIETDEKLFVAKDGYQPHSNQPLPASSPRISPHLFDAALKGNMMPSRGSSSPLEFLNNNNTCFAEPPRHLNHSDIINQPTFASNHNRNRSSSSDSQVKKFISAVEKSQTHQRGASNDSFILDDNLFGENILELNATRHISSTDDDVPTRDELAPIPVTSLGPSPSPTFNGYNAYPDQAKSTSAHAYGFDEFSLNSRSESPASSGIYSAFTQDNPVCTMIPMQSATGIEGKKGGGNSKRIRRKCSKEGCTNRVVQGGLCISHGAKRKLCGHPGCTKHVKKAGMCSAHGPPRKTCEFEGCPKVAVQGGKCIAHGAKKKMCCVEICKKQAILSGMCKKHHDQYPGGEEEYQKRNDNNIVNQNLDTNADEPNQQKPSKHTRGLSIFTDKDFAEKIIKKEIKL